MNKMKVLNHIQKLIDKLKKETIFLEKDVRCLLSFIETKQFLPAESSENIINHLQIISKIQTEAKQDYINLMDSTDFPQNIITLQNILEEKAPTISQTAKYIDAWETILRMDSDDKQCRLELAELQCELSKLNVYDLSLSECQAKLNKVVDLIVVYSEVKPLSTSKSIEYAVKLARIFGNDLSDKMIEAITTGIPPIFLREKMKVAGLNHFIDNDSHRNKEIKSEAILNINDDILIKATDRVSKDIDEDEAIEILEDVGKVEKKIGEKHAFISVIDKSQTKPFRVKVFKNDIDSNFPKEQSAIMRCALDQGCITVELMKDLLPSNEEIIKSACDYLVKKGYLKEYHFMGINTLYCLSSKGMQVFASDDGAAYLKKKRPIKKDEIIIKHPATAILHFFITKVRNHMAQDNADFKENMIWCDNALIMEYSIDEEVTKIYTSIIGAEFAGDSDYLTNIHELIEKNGNKDVFIMGYDDHHIDELMPIVCGAINGNIAGYYNFSIDEWHINLEKIENPTIADGDKGNIKDISIKDEQLVDDVSNISIIDDGIIEIFSDKQQVDRNNNSKVKAANEETEQEIILKITSNKNKQETQHIISETKEKKCAVATEIEGTVSVSEILDKYQKMLCDDKIYCATAYLKAAACCDNSLISVYNKLAYAVNDPLAKCRYDSTTVMEFYFDEDNELYDYFMVSTLLRNFFMDHTPYDYSIHSLHDTAKNSSILSNNGNLSNAVYKLLKFKEEMHHGIDKYADYRAKDKRQWEVDLKTVKYTANVYYQRYIEGHVTESGSNKRFLETQKLIFDLKGDIGEILEAVANDDVELLDYIKRFLMENFIKDEVTIDSVNIDKGKINIFMDKAWEEAANHVMVVKKTSILMGTFRTNLFNKIEKIIKVICDWIVLQENLAIQDTDDAFVRYQKVRKPLIDDLTGVKKNIQVELETVDESTAIAGRKVLLYTVGELISRLDGSYNVLNNKYFYVDFLKNSWILLNDKYLPDVKTLVPELDDFSPVCRIEKHYLEKERSISERLEDIKCKDDDYGSAKLILKYLKDIDKKIYAIYAGFETDLKADDAQRRAEKSKENFIEWLELAQSYGQIDTSVEDKKEKILQSVNEWYDRCASNVNFGFFENIIEAFKSKIQDEAKNRETSIRQELSNIVSMRKDLLANERTKDRINKIHDMIKQQNYTVAEDLINRLESDEDESELEALQQDYLKEFIDEHDVNYHKVNNAGKPLRSLVSIRDRGKDAKGGNRLISTWLSNGSGPMNEVKIKDLMTYLGFMVGTVKALPNISGKIENYDVILRKSENGRRANYKHSIAAFGSTAVERSFRVVCLYGKYDAESLLNTFKEIGLAKHTLVLLDYALTTDQRRRLARKTKSDTSEKIFGVIDRVVLMYLVNHYSETLINRRLMSVIMPYAYYQPYVVGAVNNMPPEMFIGRKEELSKIESPTGVNIVYGGRQLGKSALLRMAKTDINNDENGNRAVFVDIKGLDYKDTARKISQAMADEKIFVNDFETDDWADLSRAIKQRLADEKNKIPYLLLLLDEADAFIASCKPDYRPFDALKDIQSIGNGRFKFVVAGLRNVVRFNKDVLNNNSVLAHLSALTVKPFNVVEAKELLEIPLSYLGLRFQEKQALVSMILATTNYFPGLIQLYCFKLVEAMKKDYAGYNESDTPPYDVQEKHIKKVLAEDGFQKDIREKFMITLKVDEDFYYHIIAIFMAYLYHKEENRNGYTPEDLIRMGEEFGIGKITKLSVENVKALMEELRELNVLRLTANNAYLFTRYNFFQMMGNEQYLDDEIMQYMGD